MSTRTREVKKFLEEEFDKSIGLKMAMEAFWGASFELGYMVQHGKVEELRSAQGNLWRWSDDRTSKQQQGYRTIMNRGWW